MPNYPTSGSRSSLNLFDHTDAGTVSTYSQLLTGAPNYQAGLAKSFNVMPGDQFDLEVYAKFEAATTNPVDLGALLPSLFSVFSLPVTGGSGLESSAARNTFTVLYDGGTYVGDEEPFEDEDAPKAFLNYLLFDENYVLVDFGFDQVDASADIAHDLLSLHVDVSKKGYLYVFVSNENPYLQNVYFDDVKIVSSTNVEQVQDYYPFGLGFNSYSRENSTRNTYEYNGKEKQDELDLGWLDYGARMYVPDIGRWWVVDPLSELFMSTTPYAYALNNPSTFNDIEGLLPGDPKYTGSGNVVIILSDNPTEVWNTSTLDNTDWDYGVFGSMSEASAWLSRTYKKDGVSIQNLVIRTHGYVPLNEEGSTELSVPSGNRSDPNELSHEDLDAGIDRDVIALSKIGESLGNNAEVLFTACNACMNTNKLPEAIFRVLKGKSKNLLLFTNGAPTKLHYSTDFKVKVRKSLNGGLTSRYLYAPWKQTSSSGTRSVGRNVTPGLNTNGTFMWFYTSPGGGGSVVRRGKRMASPYHPHKFRGNE